MTILEVSVTFYILHSIYIYIYIYIPTHRMSLRLVKPILNSILMHTHGHLSTVKAIKHFRASEHSTSVSIFGHLYHSVQKNHHTVLHIGGPPLTKPTRSLETRLIYMLQSSFV